MVYVIISFEPALKVLKSQLARTLDDFKKSVSSQKHDFQKVNIVGSLFKKWPLELCLDPFNTVQIYYKSVEDVHEGVWCLTKWEVFELSHFPRLLLINNGW